MLYIGIVLVRLFIVPLQSILSFQGLSVLRCFLGQLFCLLLPVSSSSLFVLLLILITNLIVNMDSIEYRFALLPFYFSVNVGLRAIVWQANIYIINIFIKDLPKLQVFFLYSLDNLFELFYWKLFVFNFFYKIVSIAIANVGDPSQFIIVRV